MLNRRHLLAGMPGWAGLPGWQMASAVPPLREIAAAKGIVFGTMVTHRAIRNDPVYAALVRHHCAIITPGLEAKWAASEPRPGVFDFSALDSVMAFASDARLAIHLHNLVWAVGLPAWALVSLAAGDGKAILHRHVAAVAGRYRGQVDSWDVVNEPIDPRWPSAADGLCTTPWWHAMGSGYIGDALIEAAAADPLARLLINDDDLEYDSTNVEKKRNIYLRLIETWLRAGLPLHGFGLQAHIKPWLPFADAAYRRFLHELAGFGLRLYITELDVCDRQMPACIAARDNAVAAVARRYLDVALDEKAVTGLITWGLADTYTSMNRDTALRRLDGQPCRPLPFDEYFEPKPMFQALSAALHAAPVRG